MTQEKIKQKRHKTTTINSGPHYYSQSLAFSLVEYAHKDSEFANVLKSRASQLSAVKDNESRDQEHINLLIPLDYTTALRRLDWLVKEIAENRLPGSVQAAGILKGWAGDKELDSPKQIVIGITVGRIPGVTLGRLFKKVSMAVIVRRDLVGSIDLAIAQKISAVSHKLMAGALEAANGDIRRLEPDLADWFFGEKAMDFFSADSTTINNIIKELKHLGIINAAEEIEGVPGILAISPALNIGYAETVWGLKKL